jgi:hypothetical protein
MIIPAGMTKDEGRAALEIIDNTLVAACGCAIHKKGEGAALPYEPAFIELLLTQWAKATKKAVKDAIGGLLARSGEITQKEAQAVLKDIGVAVVDRFKPPVEKAVPGLMRQSYKEPRNKVLKKLRIKLAWDQVDDGAIEWLTDHHLYWVGSYYDKEVSGALAKVMEEGLSQGLGRADVGKQLKTFFDDYPGVASKPESYWRGFAANGMNRSRGFGLLRGYEAAEITVLVIRAVMDERTSEICRNLNGREIPIINASRQRDAMMEAEDPEDVKRIAPWPKLAAIQDVSDAAVLAQGVAMPPYHFHCRTTVVAKM